MVVDEFVALAVLFLTLATILAVSAFGPFLVASRIRNRVERWQRRYWS